MPGGTGWGLIPCGFAALGKVLKIDLESHLENVGITDVVILFPLEWTLGRSESLLVVFIAKKQIICYT